MTRDADSGDRRRIAVITAMRSELRPLVRPLSLHRTGDDGVSTGKLNGVAVVATTSGMGTSTATEITARLLDTSSIDHVVVVGIAGGVDPNLAIGEVIVPEIVVDGSTETAYRPTPLGDVTPRGTLRTSDEFVVDDGRLDELRARGVVAVDMETGAIGAVCEQRALPWSVFGAISDRAGATGLNDVVLSLARPDGSPNLPGVARFFVTRPWDVPRLVGLGRDARTASNAAARAAVRALAAM